MAQISHVETFPAVHSEGPGIVTRIHVHAADEQDARDLALTYLDDEVANGFIFEFGSVALIEGPVYGPFPSPHGFEYIFEADCILKF